MTLGYKKKIEKDRQAENDRKLYVEHEKAQNLRLEKIQAQTVFLTEILAWTAVVVCFVSIVQLILNFLNDFPGIVFYILKEIIF